MNAKTPRFWSNLNQLGAALIIVSLLVFWASMSSAKPSSPDPPAGFWFALLLMIAGLILLIVSYNAQARIQKEVIDHQYERMQAERLGEESRLRCPDCRALNDEKNRFCGSCGKPL